MSGEWMTKYGSRRVRKDPPTLEEALLAAECLADDLPSQIEIAASLMDAPIEDVKQAAAKIASQKTLQRRTITTPSFTRRGPARGPVVVEYTRRRG